MTHQKYDNIVLKSITELHSRCKMTAMVNLYQTQAGFKSLSQTVLEICAKNRLRDAHADAKSKLAPGWDRKLIQPSKTIAIAALVGIELGANYTHLKNNINSQPCAQP